MDKTVEQTAKKRMSTEEYLKHLIVVFSEKYAVYFLVVFAAMVIFSRYFAFAFNVSYSLPHHLYIIVKNQNHIADLKHDDYVSFKWTGDYYYRVNTPMLKQVKGLPGDVVSAKGRAFYVNGQYVGTAKEKSLQGEDLQANGFRGEIPAGRMFLTAQHKDSLDSRYHAAGLIAEVQITGKAYPIF